MIDRLYLKPAPSDFVNISFDMISLHQRIFIDNLSRKHDINLFTALIAADHIVTSQYKSLDYQYIKNLMHDRYPTIYDLEPVGIFYVQYRRSEYLVWSSNSALAAKLGSMWIHNHRYLTNEYLTKTFRSIEYED